MWPSGGRAGNPLLPCRQLRALFRRQKAPLEPGTREILGWHWTSKGFPKDNNVEMFFFFCWKSALGRSAGKGFCEIASGALVGPCSAASASLTQGLRVPFFRREN